MKLATLRTGATTQAVLVNEDGTLSPLERFADVGAFLAAPTEAREAAAATARAADAQRLPAPARGELAQPILNPAKVLCIGLNYHEHIKETGNEVPKFPTVFAKFALTLTGPDDDIAFPAEDHRLDWEGELGIVIGSGGRRLGEEQAADAIAGYTIANDVSMRGWQGRTAEWTQGKIWEASTPVGPWVVTPDEFDPTAQLTTRLNGAVVQQDSVGNTVFSPAALVAYLSTIITLEPGDLIITGTPAGVALGRRNEAGRHPWMVAGDEMEVSIEGLGVQHTRLV
ncbi:MAG: fumarylacetoacetate hydrolase family protein [Arthrobacter sp.]|nr:fumarylacetoacetate hydrolase family protein [Arthrobacter sp.]